MYLFEEDDQGHLTYGHHPFTSPWPEDMDLIDSRPYQVRARAYDSVMNGVEIAGGSIRIHERALQERVFEVLGMSKEKIRSQFGHLLDAFEYGVRLTAGSRPASTVCSCASRARTTSATWCHSRKRRATRTSCSGRPARWTRPSSKSCTYSWLLPKRRRNMTSLPKGCGSVRLAQQKLNRDPGVRKATKCPPRRDLESQGRGPT